MRRTERRDGGVRVVRKEEDEGSVLSKVGRTFTIRTERVVKPHWAERAASSGWLHVSSLKSHVPREGCADTASMCSRRAFRLPPTCHYWDSGFRLGVWIKVHVDTRHHVSARVRARARAEWKSSRFKCRSRTYHRHVRRCPQWVRITMSTHSPWSIVSRRINSATVSSHRGINALGRNPHAANQCQPVAKGMQPVPNPTRVRNVHVLVVQQHSVITGTGFSHTCSKNWCSASDPSFASEKATRKKYVRDSQTLDEGYPDHRRPS